MSHKATNWAIAQRGLKPAAKIVLWHLCDRHHPDHGCFPAQDTLAADTEVSRSSLNRHLEELERLGLIRRIQRSDKKTRRQRSTLYLFAFDFDDPFSFDPGSECPEDPSPKDGNSGQEARSDSPEVEGEPCPKMRHGAVSQKRPKPCPKNGQSRVSKWDTNPVREPIKNQRAGARADPISDIAAFWATKIAGGGHVPDSVLTDALKSEIEASGLLSEEQIIAAGIAIRKRAG